MRQDPTIKKQPSTRIFQEQPSHLDLTTLPWQLKGVRLRIQGKCGSISLPTCFFGDPPGDLEPVYTLITTGWIRGWWVFNTPETEQLEIQSSYISTWNTSSKVHIISNTCIFWISNCSLARCVLLLWQRHWRKQQLMCELQNCISVRIIDVTFDAFLRWINWGVWPP